VLGGVDGVIPAVCMNRSVEVGRVVVIFGAVVDGDGPS